MNRRQKLVQQQFLNDEEAVIKELHRTYSQALSEINNNIRRLMKRFDPETGDIPQSVVYQIKYQEMVKAQIEDVLNQLKNNQFTSVSEYLDKCYEDGFVGTLYDMRGQDIPLCFPIDQEAMVRAVQLDSKISEGLYTRLGEDVEYLKKQITSTVSRSIATGATFQHTAKLLANRTRIGYNNAIRIARTEGHRIQCQATMDACYKAQEKGADVVKQWDATLDAKTRESHVAVDGEFRKLDEKFSNGLMFPGDPSGGAAEVVNCRCALLERARWAVGGSFTKMNNFTKEIETFDSPEDYDEFKKAFFSKENRKYMNYVESLEQQYGTKDFAKILDQMTDQEYAKYTRLTKNNPVFNRKAKVPKTTVDVPEVKKPVFTPAKTRQEAEDHAKKSGVKYADYSKLPLDMSNDINRALETLPDDVRPVFVGDSSALERYWGGKLPRSSTKFYGVTIDTFDGIHLGLGNGVDFDTNGQMVGISYSYRTADKITAAKEAVQARYKAKHNGHTWFFNVSGETTPFHEMGHVYANTRGLPEGFEYAAQKWADETKCDMISNPSEAWAEAWAAYHTGANELPDYIRKFIEDAIAK